MSDRHDVPPCPAKGPALLHFRKSVLRRRGLLLAVWLPLLAPGPVTAAMPTGWISIDGTTLHPSSPVIEYVSSSTQELVLRVHTPGVLSTAEFEGEDEFRRLELPGYYRTEAVGSPLIPAVRQLIAVPSGCEVDVEVSVTDTLRYSGSSLYPVPEMVDVCTEDGFYYRDEEFSYDQQAYGRSSLYPGEIARVDSIGMLRGQGVALLTIYPIQHAPSEEETEAYPVVDVTLTFRGGSGGLAEDIGPFTSIAASVMPNYDGIEWPARAQADTGVYDWCTTVGQCDTLQADYLMIVHGPLKQSGWVDDLAEHRASWNGYNVAMVTDTTVAANYSAPSISPEAIKQFIQDVYDNVGAEHMSDGHLGYVLLVGDAREDTADAYMPAYEHEFTGSGPDSITTDYWYSCLEVDGQTDDYADVMIGRLPTASATELSYEVQKLVDYETEATSGAAATWRDTVLLSCGFAWDDPESDDVGKAASADAAFDSLGVLFQTDSTYSSVEVHAHELGGSVVEQYDEARALNRAAIDDGCHAVELCVHGCHNKTYTFRDYDVGLLTNTAELPFWMVYSCQTGAYDVVSDDPISQPWRCLGERLLHQEEDTGAVGYFGSSENCGNAWEYLGRFAWRWLVRHHYTEVGEFVHYAKLATFSATGDLHGHVIMYNLLGDPALNLMLTDHEGYGSAPDFVVTPLDLLVSPLHPSPGDTMTFSATIRNESNHDPGDSVRVDFRLCERDGTPVALAASRYVAPDAGEEETAECKYVVPDSIGVGALLLRVEVDTTGSELFKNNNSASVPFGICFERDGFPRYLWGLAAVTPTITDLDGVPELEIVAACNEPGRVTALDASGDSLWAYSVSGEQSIHGAAAVTDQDYDGECQVIVSASHWVYALDGADGTEDWTKRPLMVRSPVALSDIVGADGRTEVAVECTQNGTHMLYLISHDGSDYEWSCPRTFCGDVDAPTDLGPAIADLNQDGLPDIVTVCGKGPSRILAYDGSGESCEQLWSGEITALGGSPGYPCSPVVAEISATEPGLEVLCGVDTLRCYAGDDGDVVWSRGFDGVLAGVSVVDTDSDGDLEILASTYGLSSSPGDTHGFVYLLDDDGSAVDSMAVTCTLHGQPVSADLDSDGNVEIVVGGSTVEAVWTELRDMSYVHIFTFNSTMEELEPFSEIERPLFFWGKLTSVPVIADADEDSDLEIWVADGKGYLHCLEYWDEGVASRWGSYQHDERHTGTYETRLSGSYPDSTEVSWWGDYYLTGDVVLDNASSLFIQPGTTVRVAPDCDSEAAGTDTTLTELIIYHNSSLEAHGTDMRQTRFFSASDSPGQGQWYGVRVIAEGGVRPLKAELHNVNISHAYMGISAVNPETLIMRGCTVDSCQTIGIKRTGTSTGSVVELAQNEVADCAVGIELHSCAAEVDSNEISDCSLYGMRIYQDRGSQVRDNAIYGPETAGTTFTGVYFQGAQDSLAILRNDISGVKRGIEGDQSSYGTIECNTIDGSTFATAVRGMYFYDVTADVAGNTLTGELGVAYLVDGDEYSGARPVIGIADNGDTTCADADYPRCNRLPPPMPRMPDPAYYVKVIAGQDTVMAEANWWGSAAPNSAKFYGPVAWRPHLRMDPESRGGGTEEVLKGPLRLELAQNFPNPLNPVTTLRYAMPRRGRVRLAVYDIAGREVRVLLDGVRERGWHETAWDGRNTHGERVASGVYFCRLEDGDSVSSKKVVLLK